VLTLLSVCSGGASAASNTSADKSLCSLVGHLSILPQRKTLDAVLAQGGLVDGEYIGPIDQVLSGKADFGASVVGATWVLHPLTPNSQAFSQSIHKRGNKLSA
jgi:hypothetical protein